MFAATPYIRVGVIALITAGSPFVAPLSAQGDALDRVKWSVRPPAAPVAAGATVHVELRATIEKGWHVYSLTQPSGGPIALRVTVRGDTQSVALAGTVKGPRHEVQPTSSFGIPVELYSDTARFTVPLRVGTGVSGSTATATLGVRFQVCSDDICLPPRTIELGVPLAIAKRSAAPRGGA